MKTIILSILLILSFCAEAGTVDTVSIYSNAMHKSKKCVVIKPANYKKSKVAFPALYLLHGYSGNYTDWIKKVPQLKDYVDQFQLLIICPDGDYSSWYFDSPVDSTMRYETYIGEEVPAFIDAHYKTIKNRAARAITGLSMGGHGGIFLGFRHASIFGACGSMSGGVDINDSRTRFDVAKRLGDTAKYAENWIKFNDLTVVTNYPQDSIAIIFDCGVDDFFYEGNKRLHEKMLQLKIPHDYIERPGKHSWDYWSNSIRYQLFFFKNHFDQNKKGL